jgi:hypothetical protein
MKRWLLLFLMLTLTGCAAPTVPTAPTAQPEKNNYPDLGTVPTVRTAPTARPGKTNYPDLGAAPELVGDTWLNVDSPLRLAALHGKVVLVDMWTFG